MPPVEDARKPGILLLRADESAQGDAQAARAAGWVPLCTDMVRLEAVPEALALFPEQVSRADAVFWVSPGAVRLAVAQFPLQNVPVLRRGTHLAVGAATARVLQEYGFGSVLCPPAGNDSEALLQLPFWQERTGRLLIAGGTEGRTVLAAGAAAAGWQVERAGLYRRYYRTPDLPVLQRAFPDVYVRAAYVTAVAAAEFWFDNLPAGVRESAQSLLYLTHHARVAAAIGRRGVRVKTVPSLYNALQYLNRNQTE